MYFTAELSIVILIFLSTKYKGTILADGNFKQDHLIMKNPGDDVPLSNGHGYMTEQSKFDEYMRLAPPLSREVCAV